MAAREKLKPCGAKTHSGTKCQKPAGWGTDHVGSGRCKLHGGVVGKKHGPPKGSQNALKHGIYSRLFKSEDLDAAKAMQGTVETELAIARLQLVRLIEHQDQLENVPVIEQIEEKTIAVPNESADDVKDRRAKDAAACGEFYDPDDDDDVPDADAGSIETAPLERKRIFKRRDFQTEFTRLTALIARLEAQIVNTKVKHVELEKLSNNGGDEDGTEKLTDTQLDSEILQLAKGRTA